MSALDWLTVAVTVAYGFLLLAAAGAVVLAFPRRRR